MGMGILRRSRSEDADDEDAREPGVYRLEVDHESKHFHGEVTYSFWSASKIIFLLSILLWWLPQSAGYMVAGYVGGRRAGSPWKAVVASLIPVILIFAVSATYDSGYGREQISYLATLPTSLATSLGEAIPFVAPYSEFVAGYLTTFVLALQQLFGMGSNGYLVTIAFAYIGGIVADQTRRELDAKKAASTSVNIFHPFGQRSRDRRVEEDEDAELRPHRAVVRYRTHRGGRPGTMSFESLRKVPAAVIVSRHAGPPRRRPVHREEEVKPARGKEKELPAPLHKQKDSASTQRFVERALRPYERPRHQHRPRA